VSRPSKSCPALQEPQQQEAGDEGESEGGGHQGQPFLDEGPHGLAVAAQQGGDDEEADAALAINPNAVDAIAVKASLDLLADKESPWIAKIGNRGKGYETIASFFVINRRYEDGIAYYRKAIADEVLARAQFERSRDLYQHGAIAQSDLEVAQDTEDKAKVDLETMAEHLRLLGNDPDKPTFMVDIYAPVAGTITDQEVTVASSVQAFNTPSPFTISDLSRVWIMCDVYENDLAGVRLGDPADVRLNAYPDRVFHATVNNIGAIMDPNIRTAKVRLEVENPAIMRVGMFVKATFRGQNKEMHTIVPAAAIMRMHDRDFVFVPAREKKFRRLEVVSGDLLPNNMLDVKSGIQPGQQVVTNPLTLDHVLAQ